MADYDEKRRALLQSAVRWMILPAAALGVARMSSRKGETCDADFFCSRCRASSRCKLPQAVSYRLERKGGPDG